MKFLWTLETALVVMMPPAVDVRRFGKTKVKLTNRENGTAAENFPRRFSI
jgi:hypothetical protein